MMPGRSANTRILDSLVSRSHSVRLAGRKVHPYFIASDAAAVGALAVSYSVIARFPGIAFSHFLLLFAVMTAYYRLALALKARWLGMPSRSFLQDTTVILLPMYVLLAYLSGFPMTLALDVVGVLLPAYVALVRVGCFLGGCCYGVPSPLGVLYPEHIFEPIDGCRRYHPGSDPRGRVLPVQLAESAGALALCGLLLAYLHRFSAPPGTVLPLFLLGYSTLRFLLDFWRIESARPRWGPLSEAQLLCLCTAVGSGIWLLRAAATHAAAGA